MNRCDGQVQLKGLPMRAVVERHVDTQLSARIEQALSLGILADGTYIGAFRYPRRDPRPRLATVMCLIDEWFEVIELVPVDGGEGSCRIMRRRLDDADHAPFRHVFRRDVLPRLSVVGGDVDQPVIGARPQQSLPQRRLREREYGVVVLDTRDVERDRSSRGPLLALVVAREIAADALPAAA